MRIKLLKQKSAKKHKKSSNVCIPIKIEKIHRIHKMAEKHKNAKQK